MKKISQKERIKRLLIKRAGKKSKGITSLEAFREFGITRLSSIIHILRHKENMNIMSCPLTVKNRYGERVTFSLYYLKL